MKFNLKKLGLRQKFLINTIKELIITRRINFATSKNSKTKLEIIKKLQINFFASSINENYRNLYEKFITLQEQIANILNVEVKGECFDLEKDGIIVIANHLGINKLTKIKPTEIKDEYSEITGNECNIAINSLINNDPFVFLFWPVAAAIIQTYPREKFKLIFICTIFAEPFSRILKEINAVQIENGNYKRMYENLVEKIISTKKDNKIPIVIMYPEGGTSGKKSMKSPFYLEEFMSGFVRLSNDLTLPIIPIVSRFDKKFNFYVTFSNMRNYKFDDIKKIRKTMQEMLLEKYER